jgi:hypothetical protein
MANREPIRILTVERDGEDGLIVMFSDGTTGAYVVEELLELRPHREPTEQRTDSSPIHLAHGCSISIHSQKGAGDYQMTHSEVEALFHRMYADGRFDDEEMAAIANRIPGFRLP